MSKVSLKRGLYVSVATLALSLQFSMPALAATDDEVLAAAQNGVSYLAANQNPDGSVDGTAIEWAVIAIQADSQQAADFHAPGGASAVDFMKTDNPIDSSTATATERKIIAINSTGQDSTNFGNVDYDAILKARHTDQQIGDTAK
jgi:hypothetical protein